MRALVTTPNPLELTFADVAEPTPAPDETVVAVRASSVNRGELALLKARPNAWRPGQDLAGEVIQAAANGGGPKKGDRVVGFAEQGSWCERFAIRSSRLAVLPDQVSFAQAATLPASAMTALRTLRFGGTLIGRSILITGAAGAVGLFAVELAIQSGASVTALVNSAESEKELAPLKPDHVSHSVEDLNGPYDLVLDSVGGTVLERALATVSPAGVVVPFGNISGQKTSFNAFGFVGHEGARIQSFLSYAAGPEEAIGADLSLLSRLVQKGSLHPRIGLQVDWTDIHQALEAVNGNGVRGKAVFVIGQD